MYDQSKEMLVRKLIIIALIPFMVCCGRHECSSLQDYMNAYPQSQLCDVYKFCFQDKFGLEHLLTDSVAAMAYIEHEMESADSTDWQKPLFYYYLLDSNYVRVDLNYIRQGYFSKETLVAAMLHSSSTKAIDSVDVAHWRIQWHGILSQLQDVTPRPLNYVEDSIMIEQMLDSGQYATHHSKLFNGTYCQHYRIVRRDVFEKELLPLINQ